MKNHAAPDRASSLLPSLLCGALVLLAIALVHPVMEMGFNDDWSYAYSVKVLAATGKVRYNGWGAMPLGWQMGLGALVTKLFGFSFVKLRLIVVTIAALNAVLLQRVLVRCGLTQRNATLGTLTLALGPLVLPLSSTFMTDVPALFCEVLCIWMCLRALEASTTARVLLWLTAASFSNVLLGSVRQVVWLGVLVVVPGATWCLRHRRGVLPTMAAVWVACAGLVAAGLHWFKDQPYTVPEALVQMHGVKHNRVDLHCLMTALFCMAPVLLALAVVVPLQRLSARGRQAAAGLGALLMVVTGVLAWRYDNWGIPFSADMVTMRGLEVPHLLLGEPPTVIPHGLVVLLTALFSAVLLAAALFLWLTRDDATEPLPGAPTLRELTLLLVPFAGVYLLLIFTRRDLFDRYFSPLDFVAIVFALRLFQDRAGDRAEVVGGRRVPALSYALMALLALFTIFSAHDLFATDNARLQAAEKLRSLGIPRQNFEAGLEYDGWTELDKAGYINNPRLEKPAGAWRDIQNEEWPYPCHVWYNDWMPDLHPRYVVTYSPMPCMAQSAIAPLEYHAWLSPHTRYLYFLTPPATAN